MGAAQGQDLPGILKGAAGGALFNEGWTHGAPELPPEVKKNAQTADVATDAANRAESVVPNSEVAAMMRPVAQESATEAEATLPEPEAPKPIQGGELSSPLQPEEQQNAIGNEVTSSVEGDILGNGKPNTNPNVSSSRGTRDRRAKSIRKSIKKP